MTPTDGEDGKTLCLSSAGVAKYHERVALFIAFFHFFTLPMPAGYGKKNSTRRRVASEEIEDARPSQKEPNDDVSDDDAPAPSVKVKAEKKTTKGKGKAKAKVENPPSDDEEREDVNDAIGPNDLDLESLETTFQLLPADEATKTKLKGLASDWEGLADQVVNECNFFKDVAGNFAEVTGSLDSKVRRQFLVWVID